MRLGLFFFFLINAKICLVYIILHVSLQDKLGFFNYNTMIIELNLLYYSYMTYYSSKLGLKREEDQNFFRDVLFQLLFILNSGMFVFFPILLVFSGFTVGSALSYFFAVTIFGQFPVLIIDSKLVSRTNGGYSASQIYKFAFILVIVLLLLSFINDVNSKFTANLLLTRLVMYYIIYFAGIGKLIFFIKSRPYNNITNFSKTEKTVEVSYYESQA